MTPAADLIDRLRQAMGEGVRVRARRPDVFQVDLASHLPDGDAAMVFVQPTADGMLRVTDLGHTRMRLSYGRALTPAMDRYLEGFAKAHGLGLEAGEVLARLPLSEVAAAALRLAQVQSEADALILALR